MGRIDDGGLSESKITKQVRASAGVVRCLIIIFLTLNYIFLANYACAHLLATNPLQDWTREFH